MTEEMKAQTEAQSEVKTTAQTTAQTEAAAAEAEVGAARAEQPAGESKKEKKHSEKLEEKLRQMEEEAARQEERYKRVLAEYDNFRKRTEREKAAIYDDATSLAVTEILPVADNLERALQLEECSVEDLRKGVEMVQTQLHTSLTKLKITAVGEVGEAFDPNLHNAVSHIEDETLGENVISAVYQKGYKRNEKVVRPAMVQVAN